jgi:hypothetical protein
MGAEPPKEICEYAWLCGLGCSLACRQPTQQRVLKLARLEQQGCQVTWDITQKEAEDSQQLKSGHVVFFVAGQDGAGMWSVLARGLNHSLLLTNAQTNRYAALAVLAVTETGVADRGSLVLSADQCEQQSNISHVHVEELVAHHQSEASALYWLLATSLVLLLVVSAVACCLIASRCHHHAASQQAKTAEPADAFRPIIKRGAKCADVTADLVTSA